MGSRIWWSLVAAAMAAVLAVTGPSLAAGPPPVDPPTASPEPTQTPTPEPTGPTEGLEVVFNYPIPGTPDLSISDALVKLIDETPAQASISMSYFVMQTNHPALDALLQAYGRGVNVRVVLDSGDGQKPKKNAAIDAAYARLAETLGSAGDSFADQCNRSCITDAPDSINHNKFATFSQTGAAQDVVFQSTGNLRPDGSGDSAYNAAVIIRGDQPTYDQYVGYFDDLYNELRVENNNYAGYRGPVTSGPVTAHFFPRTDKTDTVAAALRSADCAAQPTTVRVMAAFFSRKPVRDALRDMAFAGCNVQVLARQDTISAAFCESLEPERVNVRIAPAPTKDRVTIHAKYILIDGSYSGGLNQRITWMGSHNFTANALRRNDETFVQFTDNAVADSFSGNWDRLWNDPAMSPGCSRAGAEDNASVEKSGDTEVTKIPRRSQTVKRALPGKLRSQQPIRPPLTVQGRRLITVAQCKQVGTDQNLRKQYRCRVVKRKGIAHVIMRSDKPMRVRIVQRARGTKRLLPFERAASYRYYPKRAAAIRL